VILLLWAVYFLMVGMRLVVLGLAAGLDWPFSWRELELVGGLAIISLVASFLIYIQDWE
jgi:hypothetical protein